MIRYIQGNIIQADVEALVNTVNTVGVMGKGIALTFKKAFPHNFKVYKQFCDDKKFNIGDLLITDTGQFRPKYIVNFPTKEHWRRPSKIEFIEIGMKELVKEINEKQIKSIAIPPLGCGNGGLDWHEVKPLILKELEFIDEKVEVIIYEPGFNNQEIKPKNEIKLTPARAMLLASLKNYQVLGYSINLLVIQKIAYFLQRFGEPLNLQYEKGHYGPYSHRLQHLVKYLNGHFLHFKHEETKPSTLVHLRHLDKVEAYNKVNLSTEQNNRLNEVQSLIEGFESPYGLELLATVDFIYQQENIEDTEKVIEQIGNWTQRKKELMKPFHIKVAHQRLKEYYCQQRL
ncbi:MAG: macro domain-containing protein [Bacteroidota bacterium]